MMRRLVVRGVAVALVTAGVGFTVAHFTPSSRCPVTRLVRSIMGGTKSADCCCDSCERAPVIVDLSAPWLKDPTALLPEDDLRLPDVIPPQERSKELDLIDLSLLSEGVNPSRPNYEEEEAANPVAEMPQIVSGPVKNVGPEALRVTLVESQPRPGYMPPCRDDAGGSPSYMPYAEEDSEEPRIELIPPSADRSTWRIESPSAFKERMERDKAIHFEEPPLCQEDPAAPYHYPGCPHTGPCPGTEKKDAPAMPKADEPTAKPASDRGTDARPAIKFHVTLKKSIPAEDDASPAHREVDTMEFRPTDTGAVDFFHRKQVY
jgi:hypothetical protein